jgi:hypothetical protein
MILVRAAGAAAARRDLGGRGADPGRAPHRLKSWSAASRPGGHVLAGR